MEPKKNIHLISLGCAKNLVDSENLLGLLISQGYRAVQKPDEADVAVINTCGFIREAVEETIDTILEVCGRKGKSRLKRVFVVGCFVQRYGYKLLREMPEVNGWLGSGEWHRIGELLGSPETESPRMIISRPRYLADDDSPRVQTTPFYSAYLKLAEGCSNKCTYCLIPGLTGPYRSRTPESIVAEAEKMVGQGVGEINLVAQDATMYGRDLKRRVSLEDLLERLIDIPGIRWLRLLYAHPQRISNRLLQLLERENALCPYLDIPLQHADANILRKMGRGLQGETPQQLLERIRCRASRLTVRTSLMVGFPGETERSFESLLEFVRWAEFDRLGAFIFSPEKGTAAARLGDQVPRETAEARRDAIMILQREISLKKNTAIVRKILPVLIEGFSDETDLLLKGRTATMAPEVDGQVLINKGEGVVGEIVPVRITEAHPYDLVGEIT